MSFQQIWVMWLDGNPGWWRRMIRKKDFLMIQVSMVDFFWYFSTRLPYLGRIATVPSLKKICWQHFEGYPSTKVPFLPCPCSSHQQTPWAVALRYRCFGQGAWERPYALPAVAHVVAGHKDVEGVKLPASSIKSKWNCQFSLNNQQMLGCWGPWDFYASSTHQQSPRGIPWQQSGHYWVAWWSFRKEPPQTVALNSGRL